VQQGNVIANLREEIEVQKSEVHRLTRKLQVIYVYVCVYTCAWIYACVGLCECMHTCAESEVHRLTRKLQVICVYVCVCIHVRGYMHA
jgi:hypothetical protein